MNKRCVACSRDEYESIVKTIREGFELEGVHVRPNPRIAMIIVTEATLGLRLGDVLRLKMSSFVKDGDHYRLDFTEEKTGKIRTFTVPDEVFNFIQGWAYERGINKDVKLFDVCERQVQRHIMKAVTYLGIDPAHAGSHMFRKYYSQMAYKESNYDIMTVMELLQHSSPQTTKTYLAATKENIEKVIQKSVKNLI